MLAHRLRRWLNIQPTLFQRRVPDGEVFRADGNAQNSLDDTVLVSIEDIYTFDRNKIGETQLHSFLFKNRRRNAHI